MLHCIQRTCLWELRELLMSYHEPVIHHQVLKLKDNPFTQPAPNPIWPGLYSTSCRRNIKQNNVMATVGTAGGHQLLLGIADDLQPPRSQLLGVVFTCLWHHSKLSRTATAPSPKLCPWGRKVDIEKNGCGSGLVYTNTFENSVYMFKALQPHYHSGCHPNWHAKTLG